MNVIAACWSLFSTLKFFKFVRACSVASLSISSKAFFMIHGELRASYADILLSGS